MTEQKPIERGLRGVLKKGISFYRTANEWNAAWEVVEEDGQTRSLDILFEEFEGEAVKITIERVRE